MDIPVTRAHNRAVRENKQSTHTAPIHNTQKKLPFICFLYVIKTTWTDKEGESACRRRGLYFDKLLRKDTFPKKLETLAEKQYNQHFISHTEVAELWSVWPQISNPLECVHAYSCHCVSLQRPCTNWLSIFSQRNVVESRVHKERKNALLSFLLNNDEGMGASL